jgi:hypothetical protein
MRKRGYLVWALLLSVMVFLSGCGSNSGALKRTEGGRIERTQSGHTWSWQHRNGKTEITYDGQLLAEIRGNTAGFSLDAGRSMEVKIDSTGTGESVTHAVGLVITSSEYALIDEALLFHKEASALAGRPSFGAVLLMILFLGIGVLLEVYSLRFLKDANKRLRLIVRIAGLVFLAVGVIMLVVFLS